MLGAALLLGCSSGGGSGSGVTAGQACTSTQAAAGEEACSGSLVLRCTEANGTQSWKVSEDCSDSGRTCQNGTCIAQTTADATGPSDATSAACPNLDGRWKAIEHCQSDLVGEVYTVQQSGCSLTVVEPGWTGSVSASGQVTMQGETSPGSLLNCSGNATSGQLTVDCQPGDCHVVMQEQ